MKRYHRDRLAAARRIDPRARVDMSAGGRHGRIIVNGKSLPCSRGSMANRTVKMLGEWLATQAPPAIPISSPPPSREENIA